MNTEIEAEKTDQTILGYSHEQRTGDQTTELESTRTVKQTEKGREYRLKVLIQNRKRHYKKWRRQANWSESVLLDSSDVETLRSERNRLDKCFNELVIENQRLEEQIDDDEYKIAAFNELDECDDETQRICKALNNKIADLLIDYNERSSTRSSRRSNRSGSSTSSHARRTEMTIKAARLDAELRFHQLESAKMSALKKHQEEMERLRLEKELAITKAEIDALNRVKEEETSSYLSQSIDGETNAKERILHDYLEDQLSLAATSKTHETKHSPRSSNDETGNTEVQDPGSWSADPPEQTDNEDNPEERSINDHTETKNENQDPGRRTAEHTESTSKNEKQDSGRGTAERTQSNPTNEKQDSGRRTAERTELDSTKIDPQIAKKTIANSIKDDSNNHSTDQSTQSPSKSSYPSTNTDPISRLAELLSRRQERDHLPRPEPEIFNGNLLRFPLWIKSFETLIEGRTNLSSERLYYLGRYTSGEAKEAISGLLPLNSEDAYLKAKCLLRDRFGNPFLTSDAYRKKIHDWPKIPANDGQSLRKFSDFLEHCKSAMSEIRYLTVLNDPEENQRILKKLPSYLVTRWSRIVDQWLTNDESEEKSGYPPFTEFCNFLKTEARIACNPVTAFRQLRTTDDTDKPKPFTPPRQRPPAATSFATGVKSPSTETKSKDIKQDACSLCNACHDLDLCKDFLNLSLKERKEHARSKGLCWGCLRRGHKSKHCRKKKTCKVCEGSHPSSLHDYTFKASNDDSGKPLDRVVSNRIALKPQQQARDSITSHSLIVPVFLRHKDSRNKEVMAYALLDEQSDACFITESLLEKMSIDGPEVNIRLSTMLGEETIRSKRITGLTIQGVNETKEIPLPQVYSRFAIPAERSQIPRSETATKWPHLQRITNNLIPYTEDMEIGILVGLNCASAIKPCEVIPGRGNEPYAKRTALGWGIIGIVDRNGLYDDNHEELNALTGSVVCKPVRQHQESTAYSHFTFQTRTKEIVSPQQISKMFEADFNDKDKGERSLSLEDRAFLKIVEEGIHQLPDGHFEMPLPFRSNEIPLEDNREMALKRLQQLKKRFDGSTKYRQEYTAFMNEVINSDHAERVPEDETSQVKDKVWYIPHHAVYHPKKEKIRVVFDCSATYKGRSLNKQLLQGPDLANSLVGVLLRFRIERVALMCDITKMFHQVIVNPNCRDFLRFLWWDNGNTSSEPKVYRMKVHLFGAVSSPGCANFALKKVADTYEGEFGKAAANFVREDFYVDDGLTSVPTVSDATDLIEKTKALCGKGGFTLHKFSSNAREVLDKIPHDQRALDVKNLDADKEPTLTIDRALGVQWCIQSDTFQFSITLKDRPLTRRGILATVSSVFDPLGLVAPVILAGKKILQSLCQQNIDWDEKVPDDIRPKWERWRADLHNLSQLKIRRCYKPEEFGTLKTAEMHHFSNASNEGYGQCSYIRLIDDSSRVHCSLVMAKARVTPLKPITIPRLELSAALVSVRISQMIQREMSKLSLVDVFWTDSKVALGYICNEARRFHVFVSNRVRQIRDSSSPEQWHYVATDENPADHAFRGLTAKQLIDCDKWWNGPEFLRSPSMDKSSFVGVLTEDDPEVKRVQSFSTQVTPTQYASLLSRLEYFSDWYRAKRAIAQVLRLHHRFKGSIQRSTKKTAPMQDPLTVKELEQAERCIVKELQQEHFKEEITTLRSNQALKKTSSLYRLDPFLDEDGLLRVGGRLRLADLPYDGKHPVVLPKKSHTTTLVLCHFHEKINHQGRGMTQAEIRAAGYWIIGGQSVVTYHIANCVKCRKLRGTTLDQKMADLPRDRVQPAPPFTYAGVDCFGPFTIKEKRKEIKRYGVMFTCMASRAIHIEVANNMDADSFINAYRRFIGRRGPVRQLRSDQGTNFIGARNELKKALDELDTQKVKDALLKDNCDWIVLKTNVPHASHMGGVWERQIRSARNVLNSLLRRQGEQLDDESLRTLMVEAETIVNSRPLTTESASSPGNPQPLTPNHLLTMKSKFVLPPPGSFERPDLYSRKRWRRVQHLANEFWSRWRKEYLQTLQQRQRWTKPRRNLGVDDVVMLTDDDKLPRNKWRLARIDKVYPDEDGRVRKVQLAIADQSLDKKGRRTKPITVLQRPVHNLVLIATKEETREVPIEEPET